MRITGSTIRDDRGRVVPAWAPGSPPSVISTLPDDLDEQSGQAARIGLVAPHEADRGIVGGTWYVPHDRDDVVLVPHGDPTTEVIAVTRLLSSGYGRDDVTDVLAVVLDGSVASMDRALAQLVEAARRASRGSVVVAVAGTGSTERGSSEAVDSMRQQVEDAVPGTRHVIAATVAGGVFLDQSVLADEGITGSSVVDALIDVTRPDGERMMDDAFQGFAVSFARYC